MLAVPTQESQTTMDTIMPECVQLETQANKMSDWAIIHKARYTVQAMLECVRLQTRPHTMADWTIIHKSRSKDQPKFQPTVQTTFQHVQVHTQTNILSDRAIIRKARPTAMLARLKLQIQSIADKMKIHQSRPMAQVFKPIILVKAKHIVAKAADIPVVTA